MRILKHNLVSLFLGLAISFPALASAKVINNNSGKLGAACSMYTPENSNILLLFSVPNGLLVATGSESPTTISAGYQATSQDWSSLSPARINFGISAYVIPTCQPMHGMLRLYFTSRNFNKVPSTAYINILRTTEPCVLADNNLLYNKLSSHKLEISYDVSVNGSATRELSNAYTVCTADDNVNISLGKMINGTSLPITIFSSVNGLRVGGRSAVIPINIAKPQQ